MSDSIAASHASGVAEPSQRSASASAHERATYAELASCYALGLLAAAYGLRLIGENRFAFANALGASALLALGWLVSRAPLRPAPRWAASTQPLAFALAIGAASVAIAAAPLAWRPAILAIAFAYASWRIAPGDARRHALAALAFGVAAFAPVWFALRVSSLAFHGATAWAHGASSIAKLVPGAEADLGPTAAGVFVVLLFWTIALAWPSVRRFRHAVIALLSGISLQLAFVLGGAVLLGALNGPLGFAGVKLIDATWILAVALALWLAAAQRRWHLGVSAPPAPSARAPVSLAIGCAIACAAALPWGSSPRAPDRPRVVIHDSGYLDQRLPEADGEVFGGRASGMFGFIEPFLDLTGFDARRADLTEGFEPSDVDVVVLINLVERLPPTLVASLQSFVERGGGLLMLGDHTGMDAIRAPSNEITSRFGIELNFDSAVALRRSWADGIEARPHAATRGVRGAEDVQIWTGASLRVAPSAQPIVVGRHAFADAGNAHAKDRGHLGDMHHHRNEHLGDVVLVAAAEPGRGRVLAFGDTSPFQNLALGRTRPFAERCVRWLAGEGEPWFDWRVREALALLAAGVALAVSVATRARHVALGASLAAAALPAAAWFAQGPSWTPRVAASERAIAHVDLSHDPRATRLSWYPDGWAGLHQTLFRAGYWPFLPDELRRETLDEARLLVLLTPLRAYASREIDDVLAWVERGGIAILTLGRPHAQAQPELLARLQLEIGTTPLGPTEAQTACGVVRFYDAYPIVEHPAAATVLANVFDLPTIAWLPRGRGGVLVVADSQFLLNKNVEDDEEFIPENVDFLLSLIEDLEERVDVQ